MSFALRPYRHPDFDQPCFRDAPDARFVVVDRDFYAPEGYHATAIYPEYFKIDGKGYTIPSVDCVFLPLPYSSAEELSMFFAKTLAKKLAETYDNLEYVAVCVNEGIGQGAEYREDL